MLKASKWYPKKFLILIDLDKKEINVEFSKPPSIYQFDALKIQLYKVSSYNVGRFNRSVKKESLVSSTILKLKDFDNRNKTTIEKIFGDVLPGTYHIVLFPEPYNDKDECICQIEYLQCSCLMNQSIDFDIPDTPNDAAIWGKYQHIQISILPSRISSLSSNISSSFNQSLDYHVSAYRILAKILISTYRGWNVFNQFQFTLNLISNTHLLNDSKDTINVNREAQYILPINVGHQNKNYLNNYNGGNYYTNHSLKMDGQIVIRDAIYYRHYKHYYNSNLMNWIHEIPPPRTMKRSQKALVYSTHMLDKKSSFKRQMNYTKESLQNDTDNMMEYQIDYFDKNSGYNNLHKNIHNMTMVDQQTIIRDKHTQELECTFNDIPPGLYLIEVKPVEPSEHFCLCRLNYSGKCVDCHSSHSKILEMPSVISQDSLIQKYGNNYKLLFDTQSNDLKNNNNNTADSARHFKFNPILFGSVLSIFVTFLFLMCFIIIIVRITSKRGRHKKLSWKLKGNHQLLPTNNNPMDDTNIFSQLPQNKFPKPKTALTMETEFRFYNFGLRFIEWIPKNYWVKKIFKGLYKKQSMDPIYQINPDSFTEFESQPLIHNKKFTDRLQKALNSISPDCKRIKVLLVYAYDAPTYAYVKRLAHYLWDDNMHAGMDLCFLNPDYENKHGWCDWKSIAQGKWEWIHSNLLHSDKILFIQSSQATQIYRKRISKKSETKMADIKENDSVKLHSNILTDMSFAMVNTFFDFCFGKIDMPTTTSFRDKVISCTFDNIPTGDIEDINHIKIGPNYIFKLYDHLPEIISLIYTPQPSKLTQCGKSTPNEKENPVNKILPAFNKLQTGHKKRLPVLLGDFNDLSTSLPPFADYNIGHSVPNIVSSTKHVYGKNKTHPTSLMPNCGQQIPIINNDYKNIFYNIKNHNQLPPLIVARNTNHQKNLGIPTIKPCLSEPAIFFK